MGAGKTKMITPLILLYVYEYIQYISSDKKLLLIFPEKLIEQSYQFLTFYIGLHFDIVIQKENIQNNKMISIISDTDLKKQIVNYDNNALNSFIKSNKDILVLMDEADMIIDPISSELNVPSSEKIYLNKTEFDSITDVCFDIVKLNKTEDIKNYFNTISTNYNEFKNNINKINKYKSILNGVF